MVNIPLSLFSINDEVTSEYYSLRYAKDVCAATQWDRNNIYIADMILPVIIAWGDGVGGYPVCRMYSDIVCLLIIENIAYLVGKQFAEIIQF